jgi:SIR2-like domain
MLSPYNVKLLRERIIERRQAGDFADAAIAEKVEAYLKETCFEAAEKPAIALDDLGTFWPPRLVDAARDNKGAIFFGAGLSIPCGIPGWSKLLENFKIDKAILDDVDLQSDPLTMAELASKQTGSENLQRTLRQLSANAKAFSINHSLIAALGCPIYITTNYDVLFENAWKEMHGYKIPVVVNDADIQLKEVQDKLASRDPVLFKIHGSADRRDEHLILTRRDYRTHYRFNDGFFKRIKQLLSENHVLFVGFSHRDPEVSRLVEDIIYDYENPRKGTPKAKPPHFFSLQFSMLSHTPEIFAARGIVALQPKIVEAVFEDARSLGLACALCELITRKAHASAPSVDLYRDIRRVTNELSNDLSEGLRVLEDQTDSALDILINRTPADAVLNDLQSKLGGLASQGIYLTNEQGAVRAHSTPIGLPKELRETSKSFADRAYFRQARSFRTAFVSDVDRSLFNGRGTFFLCIPLLRNDRMFGLLFSACQIGQWSKPIEIAEKFWNKHISFVLVDSNGICLLPPNKEFEPKDYEEKKGIHAAQASVNLGYSYDQLLSLSYRDRLVGHVGRSVVPVELDDDVLHFASNFAQFSVIGEIPRTRWKVALSIAVAR